MERTYWTRAIKKILYIILILIALFVFFKLTIFYMPFLIAFIISLIIEPIIKWMMKKLRFSRKISSIIVFILVFGTIFGILTWGIITIVSEATNLLTGFNEYYDKVYNETRELTEKFDFSRIHIPDEMSDVIQNTAFSLLDKLSKYIQVFVTKILKFFTSIPTIAIYFVVFMLALYFICTDKIYMIDELEHHLPEKWVKQLSTHLRQIIRTLGGYLKAQLILILISFIISLIGLYIMDFAGLNVGFPLLIALGIGFVDALPILGSGSAMVPWAIISSFNGDIKLGISIIVLWIIMSVIRQLIEPRIVSGKIRYTSNLYNNCNVYRF